MDVHPALITAIAAIQELHVTNEADYARLAAENRGLRERTQRLETEMAEMRALLSAKQNAGR